MSTMDQNSENQSSQGRLLIADADTMTCELLAFQFGKEGYSVDVVHSGDEARRQPLREYSLVIVDLMDCPDSGITLTQDLKRNPDTYNIPVIIVSKKSSEDDIVDGLDAGADDYITKPFSLRELVARAKSVVRRRKMMRARRANNIVRHRELTLDIGAGTAYLNGQQLQLTRTEYLILALFMRNLGQFYERAEVRHEAWEDESGVSDRAVDTNISRLRKKLGEMGRLIVNRQGFGYGIVD